MAAAPNRSAYLPHATHFVLFEKQRFKFFEEIDSFLKSGATAAR